MRRPVLDVAIGREGDVSVATIQGSVDASTLELFKEKLDPLCLARPAVVLLDCRELKYLNSRAIGLIMKYHRSLMVSRGRLILCALNERMVKTLDLLQVGRSLVTFSTRAEALASLQE